MPEIDLDYTHERLMAALRGIAEGKKASDVAVVRPFGQQTIIFNALNDTLRYLREPFSEDALDLVDRAFAQLKLERQSDQKDECARQLIEALIRP